MGLGTACKTTRLTSAGNIKASGGILYWLIATNPSSSIRHFTLHNATSGTSGEVHKFRIPVESTKVFSFDPPISMGTGIRIGAIEHNETVITGGYGGD
ncbi:hypothetical protein LCGC14_1537090 [marine sediment metagenome]|uniref:Uncharacterized protein n=1 Tax=marine sediment metagenome TaxID=412755 RepID=A0A0F9IU91_9ZZZZ